jgi:hypothetical protein
MGCETVLTFPLNTVDRVGPGGIKRSMSLVMSYRDRWSPRRMSVQGVTKL